MVRGKIYQAAGCLEKILSDIYAPNQTLALTMPETKAIAISTVQQPKLC